MGGGQGCYALDIVPLDCALGDPCLAQHPQRYLSISVAPEVTQNASRGPLKGVISAQKPLQSSETETIDFLGGMDDFLTIWPL